MLRELVAPAREQLAFSDYPAQPLAPDQVRVRSLFGAAKHGTEMAMYRGYAAPRGGYDGEGEPIEVLLSQASQSLAEQAACTLL